MKKEKQILTKVLVGRQIKPPQFFKFMKPKGRAEFLNAAASMRGKRVVHVSATSEGGGVAELLKSLVPYLRAVGVESDWYAINGSAGKAFFKITNKLHNALQGTPAPLTRAEWKEYERVNRLIAANLERIDCDVLVIHDPQPLAAGSYAHPAKRKIYVSHIDTSSACKSEWSKVAPLINTYHRIIFSNRSFVNAGLSSAKVKVFTPAIDPLSPKQAVVPRIAARRYLKRRGGIATGCPLVVQVSRFDIWKNPLGLIEAFRFVEKAYPDARLVLVGFREAHDNPAAVEVYRDAAALAANSPNIYLFFDPRGKDVLEFTAMAQNAADVIVQNSIREGFGLTATEAMWKGQAVIGGPARGIRAQIRDGKNGFVVSTSEDLAKKIIYLLGHPKNRKRMGAAARATVLKSFLMPRFALDHLKLYRACMGDM